MATTAPPPSSKKYQVWLKGGQIASGHDNATEANATCKARNDSAETLGVKARYEVREKE